MSLHKEDWAAFGTSIVDWFKLHPNAFWNLLFFLVGFILGAIVF